MGSPEPAWRDYVRDKTIGRGRSGCAVLLRRPADGHQVVVKEIELEGLSPKERAECENEVIVLRMMCHPNILACLDSFVPPPSDRLPTLNIVTEYCAGGTLDARIRKARSEGVPLPEAQITAWLVQLADALAHMHARRVLHRDVKAANIFLTAPLGPGRVQLAKLGDLGIARVLTTEAVMAETMIGTPYVFSPELVQGMPYGAQSDVWSLGVVLYEMVALRRPFAADNLTALAYRICQAHYPPPQLQNLPDDGPWAQHGGALNLAAPGESRSPSPGTSPRRSPALGSGGLGAPTGAERRRAGAGESGALGFRSARGSEEASDSATPGGAAHIAGVAAPSVPAGIYCPELYALVASMLTKEPAERLELDAFLCSPFVLQQLPALLGLCRGRLLRMSVLAQQARTQPAAAEPQPRPLRPEKEEEEEGGAEADGEEEDEEDEEVGTPLGMASALASPIHSSLLPAASPRSLAAAELSSPRSRSRAVTLPSATAATAAGEAAAAMALSQGGEDGVEVDCADEWGDALDTSLQNRPPTPQHEQPQPPQAEAESSEAGGAGSGAGGEGAHGGTARLVAPPTAAEQAEAAAARRAARDRGSRGADSAADSAAVDVPPSLPASVTPTDTVTATDSAGEVGTDSEAETLPAGNAAWAAQPTARSLEAAGSAARFAAGSEAQTVELPLPLPLLPALPVAERGPASALSLAPTAAAQPSAGDEPTSPLLASPLPPSPRRSRSGCAASVGSAAASPPRPPLCEGRAAPSPRAHHARLSPPPAVHVSSADACAPAAAEAAGPSLAAGAVGAASAAAATGRVTPASTASASASARAAAAAATAAAVAARVGARPPSAGKGGGRSDNSAGSSPRYAPARFKPESIAAGGSLPLARAAPPPIAAGSGSSGGRQSSGGGSRGADYHSRGSDEAALEQSMVGRHAALLNALVDLAHQRAAGGAQVPQPLPAGGGGCSAAAHWPPSAAAEAAGEEEEEGEAALLHLLSTTLSEGCRVESEAAVGVSGRRQAVRALAWLCGALSAAAQLVALPPTVAASGRETVGGLRALPPARAPPAAALLRSGATASGRLVGSRALGGLLLPPSPEFGRAAGGSGGEEEEEEEEEEEGWLEVGLKAQWEGGRVIRLVIALGREAALCLRKDASRISVASLSALPAADSDAEAEAEAEARPRQAGPEAEAEAAEAERAAAPQRAQLAASSAAGDGGAAAQRAPAREVEAEAGRGSGRWGSRAVASSERGAASTLGKWLRGLGAMAASPLSASAERRRASAAEVLLSPPSRQQHRGRSVSLPSPTPLPPFRAAGRAHVQPPTARAPPPPPPPPGDVACEPAAPAPAAPRPAVAMRRPAVFPPPVLTVRVVRASSLNNIYIAGLMRQQINPYVTLRIGDVKRRTPAVPACTSPSWEGRPDCAFRFELPAGARAATSELEVTIKDRNVLGRNEWLARYRLPISVVPPSTGAAGKFLRVVISLPSRRVRGSDAVDSAYGTELTLDLKLDDMESWWEAEEVGLNREHSSVQIGLQQPRLPQPQPQQFAGASGGNETPNFGQASAPGSAHRAASFANAARVLFRAGPRRAEAQVAGGVGALLPPRTQRKSSSDRGSDADSEGVPADPRQMIHPAAAGAYSPPAAGQRSPPI